MTLQLKTLGLSICQATYMYILQTSTHSYVNELKFKFPLSYTMYYHILPFGASLLCSLWPPEVHLIEPFHFGRFELYRW